jgi:hypothetical protein
MQTYLGFNKDGNITTTISCHVREPPMSGSRRSRAHFKETFRLGEATRSGVSERESFSELRRFLNADDAHNGNDEGWSPRELCAVIKSRRRKKNWLTMLNTIRQLHVVNRPRPSNPVQKY